MKMPLQKNVMNFFIKIFSEEKREARTQETYQLVALKQCAVKEPYKLKIYPEDAID